MSPLSVRAVFFRQVQIPLQHLQVRVSWELGDLRQACPAAMHHEGTRSPEGVRMGMLECSRCQIHILRAIPASTLQRGSLASVQWAAFMP